MDEKSIADITLLLLCGSTVVAIYFLAQRKKHISQPAFKSFLILLFSPLAALVAWLLAVAIADSVVSLPRNSLLSSAIAAATVATIIGAVRWALKMISAPVSGYGYSPPTERESLAKENSLTTPTYLKQYKVSDKRVDTAIGIQKAQADIRLSPSLGILPHMNMPESSAQAYGVYFVSL
ncbi:MAG: hypothetical protein K2X64_12230 [Rhodocyclaceae bacterium]|nr:hypothetical protein [Rhodocyclaceae bacterium]